MPIIYSTPLVDSVFPSSVFLTAALSACAAALKSASGFIRHELRERIDIRQIPELKFIYDESIEYGHKIEEKLKEINEK